MSQEKIDKYKEEKANRKKAIAAQKRNALIGRIATIVVVIAMAGWVIWSGYRTDKAQKELESQQEALNQWLEDYMATASSATSESGGVNLEISSSDATTGTDETGTDEETTSEEATTTAE